ncbi:transporter substrate-binding domain-containing protein [Faecalitalea cylindroides]|uniref:transporter substrate-binding domain-containing protein n=1 Tax=Faecalitalea cylindroides TaxID=39483 RepID=UPI000B36872B|nr:transporter substrate-binding domain-containing protein [Faecalitalea cylindroides]OUN61002.1 ABC transporter substrate-binding protein [Faecalitalea cylindroides]
MKKLLAAAAVAALALTGCASGGNTESTSDDNTFVVGMECAYAPFNWKTSTETDTSVPLGSSGYADGYDVRVAQYIADELGMDLEIKTISWDGLLPALDSGEIDAVIAGMTANDEREQGADFTTPYYDSEGMIMIVRKDSEEATYTDIQQFSGKNVVGQKGTNYDDVIDQIQGVNHVTPKQQYGEMIVALQQGDVDGITAEMAVAEGVIAANPDLTVVQFDEGKGFEADTTVSIALKEGTRDSDFFKKVQKALDNLDTETRKEWMSEAVQNQPAGE